MKNFHIVLWMLLFTVLNAQSINKKPKQELTKAIDWISSWETCKGDGAIKTDGTLWQFGKVGGCNWGQIIPINYDMKTGKSTSPKEQCTYYLKAKKIGSGFRGAKIINGGYRVYAIKHDGTLWGWGESLSRKPKKLSHSKKWVDFAVVYEGNGCCSYDIGLQKDGKLWRFPESMKPLKLKRVGKAHWSKIIIECCTVYGQKKDGTLWVKKMGEPFKRYTKSKCEFVQKELCMNIKAKFGKMSKNSILNYSKPHQKVKAAKKAGALWNRPKCSY